MVPASRFPPVSAAPPALCAGLLVFASCGGDGGNAALTYGSPIGPIFQRYPVLEGVHRGTVSGTARADLFTVVLDTGELWGFYGQDFGNTFVVSGLLAGDGAASGGSYSGRVVDYGTAPASAGRLTGSYDAQLYGFDGNASFASGTLQFSTRWFAGAPGALAYDFERPASLLLMSGHWDLLATTGEGFALDVAADGRVTASSTSGCRADGSLAPSVSGRNVHELRLQFGAAPCALPGQAVSGIVVSFALASGQRQLLAGVTDGAGTWGTALFGVR